MKKVAVLGLGTMGSGMANRLLGAGYAVAVYNRTPQRAEALGKAGARVAASPADAARDAEVIVAMVADDAASREVWLGEQGALAAASAGAVLIESSTVTPAWVRELAVQAKARGCPLLDAPVTGSRLQAHNGELLFLVGGDAAAFEKVRPVLGPMSRGTVFLGPSGSGATMKLINNYLCGVQAAGLAEAIAWIERSGLERADALGVLTGGAPGSPLVKGLSERMTKQAYEINFRLDLMAKDLRYATGESLVPLEMGRAALARFQQAAESGFGDRDMAAVIEPLRKSGS